MEIWRDFQVSTMKKGMELKKHMLYSTMDNVSNFTLIVIGYSCSFILTVLESHSTKTDQTVRQDRLAQHSFGKNVLIIWK